MPVSQIFKTFSKNMRNFLKVNIFSFEYHDIIVYNHRQRDKCKTRAYVKIKSPGKG